MTPNVPVRGQRPEPPSSSLQQIRALVTNDRLTEALVTMLNFPEFGSLEAQDDLTLLQSRLNALEANSRRMTLSLDQYEAQRQQIKERILELAAHLLGHWSVMQPNPVPRPEDGKARTRYLKDLRKHVENLLQASIHNAAFLDLGIQDSPSATHLPWLYKNTEAAEEFDNIDQAFDAYEGRLLLLGSPGSGKTTTLLHLASRLITEAEKDPGAAVPLMVNLSKFHPEAVDSRLTGRKLSWRISSPAEHRSFELWLINELEFLYNIKRSIAERWITNHQVAALLDGLDEVNDDRRAQVARLLNTTYMQQHPDSVVVVCSRIAEYQPLQVEKATRLQLRGAVTLQSLTDHQIQQYLKKAGAAGLSEALGRDAGLYDLAQSPLTLSMMTLAYGKLTAAEISSISPSSSVTDQRHQLMGFFVSRMLQRKERKDRAIPFDNDRDKEIPTSKYAYSLSRVDRYLSWLAIQLSIRMQTACSVDHLFSFFDQKTDGGEWALPRWAVRTSKTVYAFLLIVVITLPLALQNAAEAWTTLVSAGAMLAGYLVLSALWKNQETGWVTVATVIGGLALGTEELAVITKAFHALVPGTATPFPGGILFLALAILVPTLLDNSGEQATLTLRTFCRTLISCSIVVALTLKLFPVRSWAAEIITLAALVIALVTFVNYVHIDSDRTDSYEDVPAALALLIVSAFLVCGACAGWIRLIGTLHAPEAIGVTGLVFSAILMANSEASAALAVGALFSVTGAWVAGVNGAVLGGAVFIMLLLVLAVPYNGTNRLMPWGLKNIGRQISTHLETWLLSPVSLLFAIAGLRLPPRFRHFVSYVSQALILKPMPGEIEFVHRRLRDYFALRDLIPKLSEHESAARLDIIRALGFQGAAAIDPLTEIMTSHTTTERVAAITALGRIAAPEITRRLEAALEDPEPEVRAAAVRGIRKLGGDDRVRLLKLAVSDSSSLVKIAVLEAAVSADLRSNTEELIKELITGVAFDPDLVQAFIAKMSPELCRLFARHLTREIRPDLIDLLADSRPVIRANACHLMSGNLELADLDLICTTLSRDKDSKVRAAAAEALGRLTDVRTVGPLINGLRDSDKMVRAYSAWALRSVTAATALEPLILSLEDSYWEVRQQAVQALGALSNPAAAKELIKRLRDRNWQVRTVAAATLGNLRYRPATGPLCKRLRSWYGPERSAAAVALGKLGDRDAVRPLLKLISDRKHGVRSAAVKALGLLASPDAVKPLISRYKNEADSEARREIIDALGKIDHPSAAEWLLNVIPQKQQNKAAGG